MCGPPVCSMNINGDVRSFSAEQAISEEVAWQRGMAGKSQESVKATGLER